MLKFRGSSRMAEVAFEERGTNPRAIIENPALAGGLKKKKSSAQEYSAHGRYSRTEDFGNRGAAGEPGALGKSVMRINFIAKVPLLSFTL